MPCCLLPTAVPTLLPRSRGSPDGLIAVAAPRSSAHSSSARARRCWCCSPGCGGSGGRHCQEPEQVRGLVLQLSLLLQLLLDLGLHVLLLLHLRLHLLLHLLPCLPRRGVGVGGVLLLVLLLLLRDALLLLLQLCLRP